MTSWPTPRRTNAHTDKFSGKFTNHKGRNRRFTNPEELEEERRREEQKKKWRQQQGVSSSEESDDEATGDKKISEESGSESEEESSEGEVSISIERMCLKAWVIGA